MWEGIRYYGLHYKYRPPLYATWGMDPVSFWRRSVAPIYGAVDVCQLWTVQGHNVMGRDRSTTEWRSYGPQRNGPRQVHYGARLDGRFYFLIVRIQGVAFKHQRTRHALWALVCASYSMDIQPSTTSLIATSCTTVGVSKLCYRLSVMTTFPLESTSCLALKKRQGCQFPKSNRTSAINRGSPGLIKCAAPRTASSNCQDHVRLPRYCSSLPFVISALAMRMGRRPWRGTR